MSATFGSQASFEMLTQDPFALLDLEFLVFVGQLPKCSEGFLIQLSCNHTATARVVYGLPLDQELCHPLLTKVMSIHVQLRLVIFPTGPLSLLNPLPSSCLHFVEPCRLSFSENWMMMLTCMQPRGLCYKFIRGEGAQELHEDFGLLVIDHDSNDEIRTK